MLDKLSMYNIFFYRRVDHVFGLSIQLTDSILIFLRHIVVNNDDKKSSKQKKIIFSFKILCRYTGVVNKSYRTSSKHA